MNTNLMVVLVMLGCRTAAGAAPAFDPLTAIDQYNVIWTTPSENAHGSMPLGNGEIDGFTPGMWHHLAVSLKGEDMLVTADNKEVTRGKYEGYQNRKNGMIYLISSYIPTASTISA